MENKETKETKEINVFDNFFNNFIKTGTVQREFEIAKDFKVKLKVLNTEESTIADAMFTADNPILNDAGFLKLRSAAVIAMATMSVNGIEVIEGESPIGRISNARYSLYGYFLKMPMEILEKLWDCYLEILKEQSDKYSGGVVDEIKNS